MKDFLVTLPTNIYSTAKKTGNFAYNSASFLYSLINSKRQREISEEEEKEINEKLEDGWVFILHSNKHNQLLEKLQQNVENPDILFTHQNILLKNKNNLNRSSSILTENAEGRLEELWEFNELFNKSQRNQKEEDTFSIMDMVPDYDDLDYAVVMPAEDIDLMFMEYMRNHPNEFQNNNGVKPIEEEEKQHKNLYPELLN